MTEKGRAAIFKGLGHPFEIAEYPVPQPGPGAILVKVTMANICGSDLHQWRGDIDLAASGVRLPAIIGHEMTGRLGKTLHVFEGPSPLRCGRRPLRPLCSWRVRTRPAGPAAPVSRTHSPPGGPRNARSREASPPWPRTGLALYAPALRSQRVRAQCA